MRELKRIIVHHSASNRDTTKRQIREWHLAKNWSDIGYHFVVEGTGRVVRGRDMDKIGAHAKGANDDSLGICIVGSNDIPDWRWSQTQIESANRLIAALREVFGPLTVHGHRDVGTTPTVCPGVEISAVLNV